MSAVMLRVLDDAEQAAARIDWSGGGDGMAPRPDTTDTPTFVGVGAPGLAFAPLGAVVAAAAEQAQSGGGDGARASRVSLQGSLDGQTETPPPISPNMDASARSDAYELWDRTLSDADTPVGAVRFYGAAGRITRLLGLIEHPGLAAVLQYYLFAVSGATLPQLRDFLSFVG